jgi:hypothetical protein
MEDVFHAQFGRRLSRQGVFAITPEWSRARSVWLPERRFDAIPSTTTHPSTVKY